MLAEELRELAARVQIQRAEAQYIEVKTAKDGCPKRLYDTLSSFSNQDSGGILIFGLDERAAFQAVGVYDLHDLQKKVTEQCNQMDPPVRAVFTFTEYEGVNICSAEIPAIDLAERPCYYKGAGKVKGAYVRVGDADLPMTDYEIYSYEVYRKHVHDDERIVERISVSMLERTRLERFLNDKKAERPQFSMLQESQMLEMLNVTRGGVPTLAGIMNFCIYPQGIFPQYSITAVVVPGYEIGDVGEDMERFMDNKRICGTISEMVEEAVGFCKRNMKIKTIIDPDTGRRRDKTEYPLNAVREAVLNALIHRDYSEHTEGTPVQIDFFKDRLEIHSPGNLYGRMTVEQLGVARPDLRNPALAVMAESLTGAENRYSGIPTIRKEMADAGLPEPVFENRRNEFVVVLYNAMVSYRSIAKRPPVLRESALYAVSSGDIEEVPEDKGIQDLLEFCAQPRTKIEIAEYMGVKTLYYIMKKYVNPLLQSGKLAMTLPEKPQSKLQRYYTVGIR
ncbi:ATP-binding protein [Blautia marasmi]|uniref:ATP-binding protein n=1 Tax=Blautia marasmi TaxID=1917868 RepID=UPI00266DAAD9|nr:ATP-binding protein [Blautia marasmi]